MDDRMDAVKAELEAVSFVGETLAPFFLQDPRTGTAGAAFQAVAQLRAQEAADAWPFADGAEARHALSLMVNGLADGIDADDLVWEYRRLFVGPAPKPAPPWGSVYTDRECVVFGEGTLELRAWMRAHGVRRTTDERTPEDHIGLMLALMSYLARNQPDAEDHIGLMLALMSYLARNQPDDLDEFLQIHLLTWSSHFLDQLVEAADHPFYEGLARLAKASLEGIQQARDIDVTYPRFYR